MHSAYYQHDFAHPKQQPLPSNEPNQVDIVNEFTSDGTVYKFGNQFPLVFVFKTTQIVLESSEAHQRSTFPTHHGAHPSPEAAMAPSWATCLGVPPSAPTPRRAPVLRRTAGGRRPSPRWGRTSAPWRGATTDDGATTVTTGEEPNLWSQVAKVASSQAGTGFRCSCQ